MATFHAFTTFARPGLHVWREGTDLKLDLHPVDRPDALPGSRWVEFRYDFEPDPRAVRFMLFEFDAEGSPARFEPDAHRRSLPRGEGEALAPAVWFVQGCERVVTRDPGEETAGTVLIHLISQHRYRPSELYLWGAGEGRRVALADPEALTFRVALRDAERSFFCFKFIRRDAEGHFAEFEPEFANRMWTAADGEEIWTHSEAAEIATAEPTRRTLRVHYRQAFPGEARMRLWQENSDYSTDLEGSAEEDGWTAFAAQVYGGMGYGVQFWNPETPGEPWEHAEARRRHLHVAADTELWTLEGDRTLFPSRPRRDRRVELTVTQRPPDSPLGDRLFAHVWVNRARAPLETALPVDANGRVAFDTYPEVVTSVAFHDDRGEWERTDRHALTAVASCGGALHRFVVLERPGLLEDAPPHALFQDPPFLIERPGAYEADGELRFVLHAPTASRARVIGEWTGWGAEPMEMRSTRDGTYWWASIPRQTLLDRLGGAGADYHGVKYQFLVDDSTRWQDPAAGWVESSSSHAASRLLRSDAFVWGDQQWRRPGWEYLIVYQLHAALFSNRHLEEPPLVRVAREIDDAAGYLRDLGVTAVLLLPVNEVGTRNSWGYDPAFFYAVENAYGGPDALKRLVDSCHRNGLAVILDVVFNHAGSLDNILWSVARESYFDGDTRWGAMINFDHPQCRHFFAQNLVYLAREYHLDGFRLDHTGTIVHSHLSDDWSWYVRERGSGGGWDFLHALRGALHARVDSRCLLMAEHLPNEWSLTNYGGPMDTQWCDDFHDRLVDACRRDPGVTPRLADAFRLSHTACDDWYKVTNYPESHDEVGNVRDRIAYVAGWGQGLRMSKVAAAASLLSRGIPMFFMGAESAEDRQFTFGGTTPLDLGAYLADPARSRVRAWWRELCWLRRNPSLQGPSPLDVRHAEGQLLAFTRGRRGDFYVLLNFGGWAGRKGLRELGLPDGAYRELWNSTWPAFAVEDEGEHTNGGRDARLHPWHELNVPDYGALVLERAD